MYTLRIMADRVGKAGESPELPSSSSAAGPPPKGVDVISQRDLSDLEKLADVMLNKNREIPNRAIQALRELAAEPNSIKSVRAFEKAKRDLEAELNSNRDRPHLIKFASKFQEVTADLEKKLAK